MNERYKNYQQARDAARLAVLEGRGMYLSHPLERQVFEQFRDYLQRQAF